MRNPRIFVTLDPDLADAIRRIGLGTGQSQSAVIASMLIQQRDVLMETADLVDKARALAVPLSGALGAVFAKAEKQAQEMALEAMGKLDEAHLVLDQALEDQGVEAPPRPSDRGERGGVSAPSQQPGRKGAPPYINKGVRK